MRNGNRLQTSQNGQHYVDVQRADGQPILGSVMRRPVFIGNGLVAKNVRMTLVRNPGIGLPAIFDPSVDSVNAPIPMNVDNTKIATAQAVDEPVLQTFTRATRPEVEDVFADFGLIEDDGEDIDTEGVAEVVEGEAQDVESDTEEKRTPFEIAFSVLDRKTPSKFEITKEELGALLLTKRQIRAIYEGVTGRSAGQQDMGLLKQEVRKYANSGFSNYKRTLAEVERVHREMPIRK